MIRPAQRFAVAALFACATGCAAGQPVLPPPQPVPVCAPTVTPPVVPSVDPSGEWEVRWDRGFAGWRPTVFTGRLSIAREGDRWKAGLTFHESQGRYGFQSLTVDGDRLHAVFRVEIETGPGELEIDATLRHDRLVGEMRLGPVPWTPMGGRRFVLPALKTGAVERSLPAGPADAGVDASALQTLLQHAREQRSSAIVLVKDGRIVVEQYREGYGGGPLVAMSASKSIVSLAIGLLVADKKISLDTRMDALFPEWRNRGPKSAITVRQLLTHTSGLDPGRADTEHETIRDHALAAKLVFPPGTRFQYDNVAVDFLSVVARWAAGVPLDEYLEKRLFQKLDVVDAHWLKDKAGDPRGAGELFIRPVDLAKIGQLMLDGGKWHGDEIVPADWIARSVDAGQPFDARCGMLWWREGTFAFAMNDAILAQWRGLGLAAKTLQAAGALHGTKYATYADYRKAVEAAVGAAAMKKIDAASKGGDHVPFAGSIADGPVRGYSARGWLGQYLVVYPQWHVVAVRMRGPESADYGEDQEGERDGYPEFAEDVARVFGGT